MKSDFGLRPSSDPGIVAYPTKVFHGRYGTCPLELRFYDFGGSIRGVTTEYSLKDMLCNLFKKKA